MEGGGSLGTSNRFSAVVSRVCGPLGCKKDMPGTHGALKNCMLSSETWVLRWRDLRATKGFKQG